MLLVLVILSMIKASSFRSIHSSRASSIIREASSYSVRLRGLQTNTMFGSSFSRTVGSTMRPVARGSVLIPSSASSTPTVVCAITRPNVDYSFVAPPLLSPATTLSGLTPPVVMQRRDRNKVNSTSLLQQYYNSLPITKKWRRAIKKGTMMWCERRGQVVMPPISVQGYERVPGGYKGRIENCRAQRLTFKTTQT